MMLKIATAISVIWIGLAWAEQPPRSDHLKVGQARMCAQLIHCGTRNGIVRQYATRCAAEDDGATAITPMSGASCAKGR